MTKRVPAARQFLDSLEWEVLNHHPNSPDLPPSNYRVCSLPWECTRMEKSSWRSEEGSGRIGEGIGMKLFRRALKKSIPWIEMQLCWKITYIGTNDHVFLTQFEYTYHESDFCESESVSQKQKGCRFLGEKDRQSIFVFSLLIFLTLDKESQSNFLQVIA